MTDSKIKLKERKKSITVKVKISKKEIEDYLTTIDGVASLKEDFLNLMATEFDRFAYKKAKKESGVEVAEAIDSALSLVEVTTKEPETKDEEVKVEETATA